jgi:hypothetical protein
VKTLEEIIYDAGRQELAAQESLVTAIRQRTGTLLAAHALVASFFGAPTLSTDGLQAWSWLALVSLVVGLVVAAVLLAPWRLPFALDAHTLHERLYGESSPATTSESSVWLAAAGFAYQQVRDENVPRVRAMSVLSAVLSVVLVLQTLAWVVQLAS